MKKEIPVLFSLAEVNEPAPQIDRAQMLSDIESGKLEYIEFKARVFKGGQNANFVRFLDDEMPKFAETFKNKPFLRDHNTFEIEARDGTITDSRMNGNALEQTIQITTRKGMTAYVEGQIDRFSIGWRPEKIHCSICNADYQSCSHQRGSRYENKFCEILMINPAGIETSAVNNPAVDGTAMLQALDISKGEKKMNDATRNPQAEIEANRAAAAELLGESEKFTALEEQRKASEDVLKAQCDILLIQGLGSSKLPEIVQARIKKQFEGKVFKASELQSALTEAKAEVSALTEGARIVGPARVSQMFNSGDQLQAAVDDLIGSPRDEAQKNLKVQKLSGIREAYLLATGDRDFVGGYFPEFGLDAASFPVIVKNAMNKRLAEAWARYGAAGYDWWKNIVTVEHFENTKTVDWMILGTIGSLPSVAESGAYTQLNLGDNGETSAWSKYGGYVALTLEDVINDDIRAFRRLPDEAAMGGMRNISEQVAAIFTSNAGAGPALSDTGALFNATVQTTAGGHKNLLTTALGTTYTAWEAAAQAMYAQPMHIKNAVGVYGTGKAQGVDPRFCLIPRTLRGAAQDLFLPRNSSLDNKNYENLYHGAVIPITVPEWTDATDWAAVADPNILPGVMLGEIFGLMPQIVLAGKDTDAAMFSNDESRLKIRQFLTVGIGNWRALHKSNVV